MSDEVRSPARYAADIDAARERLVAFAAACSAGWSVLPRSRSGTPDDHRAELEAALGI
jgi:hypothetical protein